MFFKDLFSRGEKGNVISFKKKGKKVGGRPKNLQKILGFFD